MNSRLGLAATKCKNYLGTVGVQVAASTLTIVSFLQDDDKPSFFEAVGRILGALGKVITNWPIGKPVNGLTLILEVFKAADLIDVGAKVDAFFLKTLDAPRLVVTSPLFMTILVAAMAPMVLFAILNIIRYSSAYRRETGTRRGEDRVHAGKSRVLPTGTWFLTRLLPWLAIGPGFFFLVGYFFSVAWNGMLIVLEIFYTGSATSMGGVWVTILEGMVSGPIAKVAAEFLLVFLVAIIGGTFLAIVFLQRLVRFLWANPIFQWDSTKILRGLRDVTLAKPGRMYLEHFFILALTVFLGGLLAWLTAGLSLRFPSWPTSFFFVVFIGLIWYAPREIAKHTPDEYYRGFGNWLGDFFSPEHGIPTPEGLEAQRQQEERYSGLVGGLRRHWESVPRYQRGYYEAQAKLGLEALKILRPEEYAAAQQATDLVRRVRSSDQPTASSFDEIYRRRANLDADQATNNAMLAWLKDQYTLGTPSKTPEEMITESRKAVRGIQRTSPKAFESMVERGESL